MDGARADLVFTDPPYNVAIVELAEGPRLITNIDAEPAALAGDMPVTLSVEQLEGVALARFRPAAA